MRSYCLNTTSGCRYMPIKKEELSLVSLVEADLPYLLDCYKSLHAAPELSGQEEKTSALLARELRALGFTVVEGIGKYRNQGWRGYGVVAFLANGAGPTVMVRADMDALPIEEKTGLPWASRVRAVKDGQEVGVMHACGHDVHVTSLVGTARILSRLKEHWRGTLVLVGQPGEEGGGGAQAMIDDGAYRLCPKPDCALALHTTGQLPAGAVGYLPGNFMASLTELEVTVFGVGAHGSAPERGRDPVVMAAQLVIALQTIVSREVSPLEPAVLTVGSIHGGTASNIIPEKVQLLLSIRAYDLELRDRIIASIERMAHALALAAGMPEDRMPCVRRKISHPANFNDPELTERVAASIRRALGDERVQLAAPVMASEDFGDWSLDRTIPTCMFWLGATDPERLRQSREEGTGVPSYHSPLFAPVPEPTLRTGVSAMSAAVLDLLARAAAVDESP